MEQLEDVVREDEVLFLKSQIALHRRQLVRTGLELAGCYLELGVFSVIFSIFAATSPRSIEKYRPYIHRRAINNYELLRELYSEIFLIQENIERYSKRLKELKL